MVRKTAQADYEELGVAKMVKGSRCLEAFEKGAVQLARFDVATGWRERLSSRNHETAVDPPFWGSVGPASSE